MSPLCDMMATEAGKDDTMRSLRTPIAEMGVLPLTAAILVLLSVTAGAGPRAEIELRLEAKSDGVGYKYADGTERQLERWTVLRTADLARATARPTRNPNNRGEYEVELLYSRAGAMRYVTVGDADRGRSYCVLVDDVIDHCAAFPPEQKAIYDRGDRLMDRPSDAARKLARRIDEAIRAIAAERRQAEQAARRGPAALLGRLYRRARGNHTPQWIEGEEREEFLSSGLRELWNKADAAQRSGNSDQLFDHDPVAATNGLTMRRFAIGRPSQTAKRATADVVVGYAETATKQTVRYALVREPGGWRIDDIGNRDWSLRNALTAFVAVPGPPQP